MNAPQNRSRERAQARQNAFRQGAVAGRAGEPQSACPYPVMRSRSGLIRGSLELRNAWLAGHAAGTRERRP